MITPPYGTNTTNNQQRDPNLEYSIVSFKDYFSSCLSSRTTDEDSSSVKYTKLAGDTNDSHPT